MRVFGVAARDAPAAPSSFAQLSTISFSKGEVCQLWRQCPGSLATTVVSAKYSTAPSRLSQYLFFKRQHHARPHEPGRRVPRPDREQRAPLVEERDVRAVLPT